MEFVVSRVSLWDDDTPPCDGAYKKLTPVRELRTISSFEAFEDKFGESFLALGTNHVVTKEGIVRYHSPRLKWTVKFTSLKQLIEFTNKYGDIILNDGSITIYDDYIE